MDPSSAVTVKEDNSKWNKKKIKKNKMILVRLNTIISILSLRARRKNIGQYKKKNTLNNAAFLFSCVYRTSVISVIKM